MLEKKGLMKLFGALSISFLLICFVSIYKIQYQSIWSESALKPMWDYDTVRLGEGMWNSGEALTRDDKIKLYFALGSAKKYRGSEKKYRLKLNENSLIYQRNLIAPYVMFITDRWDGIDDVSIVWEYEKNTIYVGTGGGDNEKVTCSYVNI